MYYTINKTTGRIDSVGIYPDAGIEDNGSEPFTIYDAWNYRFDFETKTWIYDPIIMIPTEITKLQCVEQLRIDCKYNDLITALKLDDTGWDMIRWEAAAVLVRDSQMVSNFAIALGMTSEDVDTFFVNAYKILL